MASKTWYFSGTCKWAKVREPDKKYEKYSIDLYMQPDQFAKYQESGAQLKVRTGDDGEYVTFSRPCRRIIKGELVEMGPPDVLTGDGGTLDEKTLVGNGSHVTLKVVVFDTVKGKGTRLEAVRVDELVAFSKPDVDEDIDEPF